MPSLTSHLLALDPASLTSATQHPFLSASAHGTLPLPLLQHWLAQDRLYQFAHLSFLSSMLSHINLSTPDPASSSRPNSLEWRAADLLIDALNNIRSEIGLFEDTAREEGWLEAICDAHAERGTRAYEDLFAGVTARGRPLVVGLVALWATEECYLRAWRYAWGCLREKRGEKGEGEGEEGEGDVMQRVFIPNWSSAAFEAYVKRIGGLVNRFGGYYEVGSWEWVECEKVWRQVLWVEEMFWPDVEGEGKK